MAHPTPHQSPRQNRVDPWSRLLATPARGRWMGNRGCLHDDQRRIMRHHQGTRWIICLLEFRGRKRTVMQPGLYTELFFLDEATALAAGHRPCAECQHARYRHFLDLWAPTEPDVKKPRAQDLDRALHAARWSAGSKVTFTAPLQELPAGVLVTAQDDEQPYLVWQDRLWQWSFTGYSPGPQWSSTTEVRVLTPRPTLNVLAAGYPVEVHPALPRSPLESGIAL